MPSFPDIRFAGQLRTSQSEVAALAAKHFDKGNRRLHIVAPPGSGKTILGLYLWAHLVKKPAMVLSPNSAIQAQWAARTDLFRVGPANESLDSNWISTQSDQPSLLTSLTYQSVTLPQRGNEDWEQHALVLWKERLVEKGQAQDLDEAGVWLEDLQHQNPEYYEDRLGIYRKRFRDGLAADGRNLELLHRSSIESLKAARSAGIGLLILDECHHLVGHWGRVLNEAIELLGHPVVIGLTATPPDTSNKSAEDVRRYEELLGEVLYEVPVPAVVKDGFLAPYQDLVQFVRPTGKELDFISNVDRQFMELLRQTCQLLDEPAEASVEPTSDPATVPPAETQSDESQPHQPQREQIQREQTQAEPKQGSLAPPIANESEGSAESAQVQAKPIAPRSLLPWVYWVLENLQLPQGKQADWKSFEKRDPTLAQMARQFLMTLGVELPKNTPKLTLSSDLIEIRQRNLKRLADYQQRDLQHGLQHVAPSAKHRSNSTQGTSIGQGGFVPAELLVKQIHHLPLEIVTPVLDRYIRHRLRRSSNTKDQQLAETLIARLRTLGVQITETGFQACASPVSRVLAYSQSKANAMVDILETEFQQLGDSIRAVVVTDYERTSAVESEIKDLLSDQAGGAIAAFRAILDSHATNRLDPVLLTGSTVLVDHDLDRQLTEAANQWLNQKGLQVELRSTTYGNYVQLEGTGKDWCPRVYVEMITELFQQGLTKCLVGTRGLLGEGWDASRTNVLVDLTTVTTSMSINQLRGRSIRLDKHWPEKLANNWDVVCVAPEFTKGYDDFHRFKKKHASLFGVADDGQVEKGAGHVHAVFNEMQPEQLEGAIAPINVEMINRAAHRAAARAAWKIGQPYAGTLSHSVELRRRRKVAGRREFSTVGWRSKLWNPHSLTLTIGEVVLRTLQTLGKVGQGILESGERENETVRVFLKNANAADARVFAESLSQTLGPIDDARYIIPREVTVYEANWISKWFPSLIGRWMESKSRQIVMWHAVPDAIAANKDDVKVFESFWNRQIGVGRAIYAHRGEGREQLTQAIDQGLTPDYAITQTEVFH